MKVDVFRPEGGDLWVWRSRPPDDQLAEQSPDGFVSAVAAITAAQAHFGPGGVSIIV